MQGTPFMLCYRSDLIDFFLIIWLEFFLITWVLGCGLYKKESNFFFPNIDFSCLSPLSFFPLFVSSARRTIEHFPTHEDGNRMVSSSNSKTILVFFFCEEHTWYTQELVLTLVRSDHWQCFGDTCGNLNRGSSQCSHMQRRCLPSYTTVQPLVLNFKHSLYVF